MPDTPDPWNVYRAARMDGAVSQYVRLDSGQIVLREYHPDENGDPCRASECGRDGHVRRSPPKRMATPLDEPEPTLRTFMRPDAPRSRSSGPGAPETPRVGHSVTSRLAAALPRRNPAQIAASTDPVKVALAAEDARASASRALTQNASRQQWQRDHGIRADSNRSHHYPGNKSRTSQARIAEGRRYRAKKRGENAPTTHELKLVERLARRLGWTPPGR